MDGCQGLLDGPDQSSKDLGVVCEWNFSLAWKLESPESIWECPTFLFESRTVYSLRISCRFLIGDLQVEGSMFNYL